MPESIIYHIDVNSAFLSWEAIYRLEQNPTSPDIRDIPAVIGGNEEMRHGIVLAKSSSAKRYGINTGEPLSHARRKCPNLQVYPPHFDVYVERSNQFMEFLRRYAPSVEAYSIDEAFCDMTGTTNLYGDPIAFAHQLKDMIRDELHFTVNVGISTNRLLAKMASDFEKPDRVHTLFPDEIPSKLWSLPVEDLFLVGKSSAQRLRGLGISTIGELAQSNYDTIVSIFKSHGDTMWNYANGIESNALTHSESATKGYGNSITLPFDVTDPDTAKHVLLSLCETVGARIRAAGAYISVVQIQITDNDFHNTCHQMTLPSSTNVTEKLYACACELFDSAWDYTPIRLLGVSTSKATSESYEQYNLFDMERNEKLSKLNSAVDKIRNRYGEDSIKRACFVEHAETGKDISHMTSGMNKAKRNNPTK